MSDNNGDYKSYIYALARLDAGYHHIVNLNNLFKRFFLIGVMIIAGAIVAEFGIYFVTKITLASINLVRFIEYEKPINFHADNISTLLVGNVAMIVIGAVYMLGLKTHEFFASLKTDVHKAQKELGLTKNKAK